MTAPLRVLIACESSGVMRRSFEALGHDACAAQWGGYAADEMRRMA